MKAGQAVLVHGAAGNVGAYAVQLAKQAELQVFATAGPADVDYVRGLGAETVVNYKTTKFEDAVPPVDAVLDTVGGEMQQRSFRAFLPNQLQGRLHECGFQISVVIGSSFFSHNLHPFLATSHQISMNVNAIHIEVNGRRENICRYKRPLAGMPKFR